MSRGTGVGVGADLDISLMDWSCEEKKEYGAELGERKRGNMSGMMLKIRGGWNGLMERKGQTAVDQVGTLCFCRSPKFREHVRNLSENCQLQKTVRKLSEMCQISV